MIVVLAVRHRRYDEPAWTKCKRNTVLNAPMLARLFVVVCLMGALVSGIQFL
jgi:hypothetical protein